MKTRFSILKLMTFIMFITAGIAGAKSDSLPLGVTDALLNSLTDENGQKLIQGEDPEGDAMQERHFTGFAASDQFGYSLSSAGDVNGDGYADIIVGAPLNDAGGSSAGRAYIYFGGIIINSVVPIANPPIAKGNSCLVIIFTFFNFSLEF